MLPDNVTEDATPTFHNSYVNEDFLKGIKESATTWTPLELSANPFREWTDAEMDKLMGLQTPE